MSLDPKKSLKYVYTHWQQCMLIPGLLVYLDFVILLILAILVVIGVIFFSAAIKSGEELSSHILPGLFSGVFHHSFFTASMAKFPAGVLTGCTGMAPSHASSIQSIFPILTGPSMNHFISFWGGGFFLERWAFHIKETSEWILSPLYHSFQNFSFQDFPRLSATELPDDYGDGDGSSYSKLIQAFSKGGTNFHANFQGGLFYFLFWFGFEWRLYGKLQREGFDAPPDEFQAKPFAYFIDGLKGLLFYLPLNLILFMIFALPFVILYFLAGEGAIRFFQEAANRGDEIQLIAMLFMVILALGLVSFFLAPFLTAPIVFSAHSRKLSDLYNLPLAIQKTIPRYPRILLSYLLIFAFSLLLGIAELVFGIATCCIGFLVLIFVNPFIAQGGFKSFATHLIAQAYFDAPPLAQDSVIATDKTLPGEG
ncbi:MAG: hypothetical protein K2X66_10325 [Cyanobacteria bacterium]|nr:hypothetical protein [Cyanobacteriota bacterium]